MVLIQPEITKNKHIQGPAKRTKRLNDTSWVINRPKMFINIKTLKHIMPWRDVFISL